MASDAAAKDHVPNVASGQLPWLHDVPPCENHFDWVLASVVRALRSTVLVRIGRASERRPECCLDGFATCFPHVLIPPENYRRCPIRAYASLRSGSIITIVEWICPSPS